MSNNIIAIGRLLKPFGIEGLLRFESYSGMTEHLCKIDEFILKINLDASENNDKNSLIQKVEAWYTTLPLRCKIEGIDNPEDARKLMGMEVYVDRSLAAQLGDEEYYMADLLGLTVKFEGKIRGKIEAVYTDAYAPLFEICWLNNKKNVIPFIKEFFNLPIINRETGDGSIEIIREDIIEDEI